MFSYFQRVEPKKLAATVPDDQAVREANKTPQRHNSATKKKGQTPKESSRKPMNMSDIYSADSPKSEKRKQSPDADATSHRGNGAAPTHKSKSHSTRDGELELFCCTERKTLNARNQSDEGEEEDDDDEGESQIKLSKVTSHQSNRGSFPRCSRVNIENVSRFSIATMTKDWRMVRKRSVAVNTRLSHLHPHR